ncbi:hypothetical protein CRENBAI_006012 [Crenichthys baileyi]|uniref:Uncharacterized protein n=1 Tax=Crenichthys baileyi TaxID=28760 RepID=A0AAV9QP41_9TELE
MSGARLTRRQASLECTSAQQLNTSDAANARTHARGFGLGELAQGGDATTSGALHVCQTASCALISRRISETRWKKRQRERGAHEDGEVEETQSGERRKKEEEEEEEDRRGEEEEEARGPVHEPSHCGTRGAAAGDPKNPNAVPESD